MDEPYSIQVSADELADRIRRVSNNDSLDTVSDVLGGPPYQQEEESGTQRAFWRFHITDRSETSQPYEVFLGEFVDDQLTFGSIIPHGASPEESVDDGA